MRNLKRLLSVMLAAVTALALSVPAFAAVEDTGFSDVPANAWYAEAVEYVRDNGLMSGTSSTTFSPNGTMTRAMLATTLYREAGSPSVSGTDAFTDTQDDAWYGDAVLWASQEGVVSGYGNGLFGTNDPVSREQIATILWRYAGSPSADRGQDFSDEGAISAYAADAVDWARANGIVNGMEGNRFAPQGNATRAQVATILRNYITQNDTNVPSESGKTLVVYFSGSGNTETAAEYIAEELDADIFEITPVDPYTDADLDWTDDDSRVNAEHEDVDLRDIELVADTVDNWDEYDTVFIGYPIWWGIAAWPVNGFVEANDFTGKTVIPFATSTSSGMGESGELLAELAGTGDWQEGQRFSENPSRATVSAWIDELNFDTDAAGGNDGDQGGSRTLVAYFSASGNTEAVAQTIADTLDADLFEITPADPYTDADLDWTEDGSRVNAEHDDVSLRDIELVADTVDNWDEYDTVFIGYPIWWGIAAWPVDGFVEANDFSGKTVIPFATSSSSGMGESGELLAELAGTGDWQDGQRFRSGASENDVQKWVADLNLVD
jgi:flavodoxin